MVGGRTYEFSFWAKQVSAAPSYVQQYQVQWRNAANATVGGTGLVNFNGTIGEWRKVTVPGLVAPADAAGVRIVFRFVTGAIAGSHGEVFIDDVALEGGGGSVGPGSTNVLKSRFSLSRGSVGPPKPASSISRNRPHPSQRGAGLILCPRSQETGASRR